MTVMAGKQKLTLERVYIWQMPVRFAHWFLFFSIVALSGTGYYIGHPFISVPGPAREHFVMGTIRVVHLYAAIVFVVALLVRLYWFFAGNRYARWPDFVPLTPGRLRSLLWTTMFYTFARREPDHYPGHNALAGASYAFIFLVYLAMVATGLALYTVYAPGGSPFQVFGFLVPLLHGLQTARLIHHIGMWLILVFAVVHVYFVVLSSIIEHVGTFDSIISGYKFLPVKKADGS